MARCYSCGEIFASRYNLHCHWENINQNCLEILPSEFACDTSSSGSCNSVDTDLSIHDDRTYTSNREHSDQGSHSSESLVHYREDSNVSVTEVSFTDHSDNDVLHDFDFLESDHKHDVQHINMCAGMYNEESSVENSDTDPTSPSIHILEASLLYLMNQYSIPLTSYKYFIKWASLSQQRKYVFNPKSTFQSVMSSLTTQKSMEHHIPKQ